MWTPSDLSVSKTIDLPCSPFCTAVFNITTTTNNNNDNDNNNNNKYSNRNHWHKQSESQEDWAELNGSRVETRSQMTSHCKGNPNHSKADPPPPPALSLSLSLSVCLSLPIAFFYHSPSYVTALRWTRSFRLKELSE